jgi:hypothetical protein
MNRNTSCVLLGLGLLWGAWYVGGQATSDVAVLHVADVGRMDHFVTLWVVDDGEAAWLRAMRPDREWLDWVQERPRVELVRNGQSRWYSAEVVLQPDLCQRVDELMREKYRWADRARELVLGVETVAVRLEPVN